MRTDAAVTGSGSFSIILSSARVAAGVPSVS
jgi:hypothetical protein